MEKLDRRKKSKNFGFVLMTDANSATEAIEALKGYDREIFLVSEFKMPGKELTQLEAIIQQMESGDSLVIYKLNHLVSTLTQVKKVLSLLDSKNIRLIILKDKIDTENESQKALFFALIESLVEFQRCIVMENSFKSLKKREILGRLGGRKRSISDDVFKSASADYYEGKMTVKAICDKYAINKSSFYRLLSDRQIKGERAKKEKS